MITVTESACKELEAYFAGKPRATIRVYMAPGGCCGPRLSLALDEVRDGDASYEDHGFTFCITKELLNKVESVTIDLTDMGFSVESAVPLSTEEPSGGCAGCSGGCGH